MNREWTISESSDIRVGNSLNYSENGWYHDNDNDNNNDNNNDNSNDNNNDKNNDNNNDNDANYPFTWFFVVLPKITI